MGLYQTLYFMSLVGGMAGLFSWAVAALISVLLSTQKEIWVADFIAVTVLGGFIGGLTVAFSDRWSGDRGNWRWTLSGAGIGIVAGLIAGAVQIPLTVHLGPQAPVLTRLLAWMLAGFLIGLGLGLRWISVNRLRVVHASSGGLIGGLLGGLIFALLGSLIPDFSQAVGFVAIGVGICFGVTLAPILLRDGVLQFVSSGDARAQYKFGRTRKEWELQQGDSYAVGSEGRDFSKTAYRPEVQIFIPDGAIAVKHAILFGKDGRFYLARHPDVANQAGLARYIMRVGGKTITSSQELRDRDDILLGRTALRFVTRKKES